MGWGIGKSMGFERHGSRAKVMEEAGNGKRHLAERRGSRDGIGVGDGERRAGAASDKARRREKGMGKGMGIYRGWSGVG